MPIESEYIFFFAFLEIKVEYDANEWNLSWSSGKNDFFSAYWECVEFNGYMIYWNYEDWWKYILIIEFGMTRDKCKCNLWVVWKLTRYEHLDV